MRSKNKGAKRMKKSLVGKISVFVMLIIATCLFCACAQKVTFVNGESLSMLIDETRYLRVSESGKNVSLASSDENIVSVDKKGFIYGKSLGKATVSAYVDGKKTDEISITVTRPTVNDENVYYGLVDLEQSDNICITVNEKVVKGEKIYAYAKKDGTMIGEDFAYITGNAEGYFSLKDLKVERNGIYEFGFAKMEGENSGFVLDACLTDNYFSYGLTGADEDITFYGSELRHNELIIMNSVLNYGGMMLTFDVYYNENGEISNRYIDVSVLDGYSWSLKIAEGDGISSSTDTSLTGDVRIYEYPNYTVDLCQYTKFIKKGKVTLSIYAIDDTLKLDKIVNYSKTGKSIRCMKANYSK